MNKIKKSAFGEALFLILVHIDNFQQKLKKVIATLHTFCRIVILFGCAEAVILDIVIRLHKKLILQEEKI